MSKNMAQQMIAGLNELAESLEKGEDISKMFNVRKVELKLKPTRYNAGLVKKTRKSLNASQTFFAKFLGVSPNTVRAWEQGTNLPSGLAARFMDEIRRDPDYWRGRLLEVVEIKKTSPAVPTMAGTGKRK